MPPDPSTPPPVALPRPALEALTLALGSRMRWRLLAALSHGEPRELGEMARVTGTSKENTFRHLGVLMKAGLIVRGRGRLYQIPKERLPQPGQPLVDAGHCLLRLDQAR